jgi:hypothetical protein
MMASQEMLESILVVFRRHLDQQQRILSIGGIEESDIAGMELPSVIPTCYAHFVSFSVRMMRTRSRFAPQLLLRCSEFELSKFFFHSGQMNSCLFAAFFFILAFRMGAWVLLRNLD